MIDRIAAIGLAALLLVALIALGITRYQLRDVRNEYQSAKEQAALERQKAEQEALQETERRVKAQQEVVRNAEKSLTKAREESDAAKSANERLRKYLASIQPAASPTDSCAAERSQAASLAGVLQECTGRYLAVARETDEAIVRGMACTAAYDALSATR
jgi:uncharacterized protein HemX